MRSKCKVDEFCSACAAEAKTNQRMATVRATIMRAIARENGFEPDGPGVWTKTFPCHDAIVVLYERNSKDRILGHISVLGEWCDAVREFVAHVKRRLERAP